MCSHYAHVHVTEYYINIHPVDTWDTAADVFMFCLSSHLQ